VEEVKQELLQNAGQKLDAMPKPLANAILEIAGGLIRPTLTFNLNETESRKLMARAQTNPVYFRLKKGEMIIREGDRVTEESLLKLQALNRLKKEGSPLIFTLGIFFLLLLVISLFYAFSPINIRRFNLKGKDYLLLSIILVVMVLIIKFSVFLSAAFGKTFPFLPAHSLLYAPPFALGAMLIAVVLNGELAAMFSVVLAIVTGIMLDIQLKFFIYPFMSSIVAAQQVVLCKERSTLIRAGFIAGVVNILLILCFAIVRKSFLQPEVLFDVCCGFLGGVLTGVIATGLVPLIEIAFDYTTNIKLLELADLNQPLLKELSMKAPGTYQHSIMVGNLADAATDAVGANSLLVRVSAYYHDIGKIRMASYFAENQLQGENKHEKLSPSMSSLIILSHVKDGVELAREHRLGGAIRDIIRQHHGNSVISFFYQKARNTQDPGYETVSDKDFRYPGPKPQTKEAALVMLADAVEAASKTLAEPSLPRIQGMVQKIINGIFIDEQLDECELTLKNLHAIANCFNRVLAGGVFHQRVEYPTSKPDDGGAKRKTNGKDKKQSEADKDKPKVDKGAGERDLKRLGLSKG
jgi:putative nucleotidyltransferase with HDIG domain